MSQRRPSHRRKPPYALLVLLGALYLSASAAAGPLEAAVDRVLNDGRRNGARAGVCVVAVRSGRVIYRRNVMERFIAASNEKLVTAAAALRALGPDYEFVTGIYAAGPVAEGALRGDLLVRGGGDPTIGGRYDDEEGMGILRRWARRLKERGIEAVTGDLVLDDRFFDRAWYHPDWSRRQAWKWYFPTTGALSLNDNCMMVTVRPGPAPGEPAAVSAEPASAPVEFDVHCTTSGSRHVIWFERAPDSAVIKVGGNVRADSEGYSHRVTVPNPTRYFGAAFAQALREEGVDLEGRPRAAQSGEAIDYEHAERLLSRRTPLVPVLRTMLRRSHNHYAEQVMKTIGAESSGRGTWPAGAERAGRMLSEMGFRETHYHLSDGSGLSRENELPPALLTAILVKMHGAAQREVFRGLLARAGRDGTLRNRLEEPPYAENVRAKTGYLNGVGALSGYARTRSGIEVAFSILVNDDRNPPGTYSMRGTVDPIARAIVDHAE